MGNNAHIKNTAKGIFHISREGTNMRIQKNTKWAKMHT